MTASADSPPVCDIPPMRTADPTADALADPTILIDAEQLIIGRQIHSPIHDSTGLLLLAAGSVITNEFKRLLASRAIGRISVSEHDYASITINNNLLNEALASPVTFGNEMSRKLDSIIGSGSLFVANIGPAVRDQMVFHGRRGLNQKQQDVLARQQHEASAALEQMLEDVAQGHAPAGAAIGQQVTKCLNSMTTDCDAILNIAHQHLHHPSISSHALKTSLLGMAIAIEMGLDADNVRKVGVTGLLENWGMLRVPEQVRTSPLHLPQGQFLEIQKHPIYVLETLQDISSIPSVVPVVAYQIHERLDGTGYPRGRKGNSIHLFARILQVADIYVAMTSLRPHRLPLMPYAVMVFLLNQAREQKIDVRVVRALLNVHSLFPIGSLVNLSDGSIGRVIRRNRSDYMHPIVQRLQNPQGQLVDRDDPAQILDLIASGLEVVQPVPTPGKNEINILPEQDPAHRRSGVCR